MFTAKPLISLASSDLDGAPLLPRMGIGPMLSLEAANCLCEYQPKNWKVFSEINYD